MTQEIIKIPIEKLNLWTENPRDPMDLSFTDYEIIERAVKDENTKWNLPKFLEKMGKHYDFSELPTVVKEKNKYFVYDGNRRIAVIKYLQNKEIYQSFGGGMFPEIEPKDLLSLKEIPCNICDKETALDNIERKHMNSGTWSHLERDYFIYQHRGAEKSIFLMFEEATGLISSNKKLNQGFVKDEVLTKKNLESIGFKFKDGKLFSKYDKTKNQEILDKITEFIETGEISTRKNRNPKLDNFLNKNTELKVGPVSSKNEKNLNPVHVEVEEKNTPILNQSTRRTPAKNPYQEDIIFGKKLILEEGKVNILYSGICLLYDKVKKDDKNLFKVLPILGMSLRLILDLAGREYFKDDPEKVKKDQLLKDFISVVKKDFKELGEFEKINYISLNQDWLESESGKSFEAPLGKWAHGNLPTTKQDVLLVSYIVGDVLRFYFSNNKK